MDSATQMRESDLIEFMLDGVVVKRCNEANKHETEHTLKEYNLYRSAKLKLDMSLDYGYTSKDLLPYDYLTQEQRLDILVGKEPLESYMTTYDAEFLLNSKRDERINSYVEKNPYYRMLLGLPPIGTKPDEFVYVLGTYLDPNTPIHLLNSNEIQTLKNMNIFDKIIKQNPDKPYIEYIQKGVDLIRARDAKEFDIVWYRADVSTYRYVEFYQKESNSFKRTSFNRFRYSIQGKYEDTKIMELKLNAYINFRIDHPLNRLDRNNYTEAEARLVWSQFNLVLPNKLPGVYRDSITSVLHHLTRHKGTNEVIRYIAEDIFGGLNTFKYFLLKRPKKDVSLPMPEGAKVTDYYDIVYVKTHWQNSDPYDKISEEIPYNRMAKDDPLWWDDDEVRSFVENRQFSYITSKYLGVDSTLDLIGFTLRLNTLFRMLINNKESTNGLKFYLREISKDVSLFDMMMYITSLVMHKQGFKDKVPDSLDSVMLVMGFKTPEKLQAFKDLFIHWFEYTKYKDLLVDFPEVIDNETFFTFLNKVNKAIDLQLVINEMIEKEQHLRKLEYLYEFKEAVVINKTIPEAFGTTRTEEGITFSEYIRTSNLQLYDRLQSTVVGGYENIVYELDYMLTILDKVFESYVPGESFVGGIMNEVNGAYSDVVKYMRDTFNMFKSFTVDLIFNDLVYIAVPEHEFLKTQDYARINDLWPLPTNYTHVSNFDGLMVLQQDIMTLDGSYTNERLYEITPYGDILIS
ncbi:MAG: hypothetical protein ACRCX2_39220 [Paraclostridium sp.]